MTWKTWADEMKRPEREDGESEDEWTDRIHREGNEKGWNRQCSIGWHEECSDRGQGDCECPCHRRGMGHVALAFRWLIDNYDAHLALREHP